MNLDRAKSFSDELEALLNKYGLALSAPMTIQIRESYEEKSMPDQNSLFVDIKRTVTPLHLNVSVQVLNYSEWVRA